MFEKLIQKSVQLKETLKENIAVKVHDKLADIPFASRLFPGAGLAVRAHVRGGDAMMQKALHPDCSFATRRQFFNMAIKEYDLGLNLTGRAYGVSKYLNPQPTSSRVTCVNNIPPGELTDLDSSK